MESIRILIAEDDALQRCALSASLDGQEGLSVVGEAENGVEALTMIRELRPQVLLLDMVMPRLDGFGLLERWRRIEADRRPAVIATTALARDDFITRAINLGVAYYLVKPIDLEFLVRQIQSCVGRERQLPPSPAPEEGDTDELERLVTAMLMQIGVPAHLSGYKFIRSGLIKVADRPELFTSMTRTLYPELAAQYGTTVSCVERAVRHAIAITWDRGGGENYRRLLGRQASLMGDRPTNSEFLAQVSEGVRLRRGRHGR